MANQYPVSSGTKREGLIGIDTSGRIGFLDEIAEHLTGLSSKEVIGKTLTDVLEISECAENKGDLPSILKRLKESGRPIPNRSFIIKNCSSAGERGRASGFLVTICDNKANEPPMKAETNWPELLINSLDDDFTDIITIVLGNISLAKLHARRGDKILEKLEAAEKACLRAKTLVRRLFLLANIGVPVKETADISDLIRNSIGMVLRDSDIVFSFHANDDLWPVRIDESQIAQVITSLVLDWTETKGPGGAVRVRAENISHQDRTRVPLPHGNYVRIRIGLIGSRESKKTEGPFPAQRAAKKRKPGLGFAVACIIIRKHEGHIEYIEHNEATPELGTGDMYHIYIPAVAPFNQSAAGLRSQGKNTGSHSG